MEWFCYPVLIPSTPPPPPPPPPPPQLSLVCWRLGDSIQNVLLDGKCLTVTFGLDAIVMDMVWWCVVVMCGGYVWFICFVWGLCDNYCCWPWLTVDWLVNYDYYYCVTLSGLLKDERSIQFRQGIFFFSFFLFAFFLKGSHYWYWVRGGYSW